MSSDNIKLTSTKSHHFKSFKLRQVSWNYLTLPILLFLCLFIAFSSSLQAFSLDESTPDDNIFECLDCYFGGNHYQEPSTGDNGAVTNEKRTGPSEYQNTLDGKLLENSMQDGIEVDF